MSRTEMLGAKSMGEYRVQKVLPYLIQKLKFWPKIKIVTKNTGETWQTKFVDKIKFERHNFCEKFKFWPNVQMLTNYTNFCRK